MVCRLCGAANPPQQMSCVSCGSPLEHTPEARGARKHAEGRSAWYVWLALCLFVGGGLGFLLVRLRTPAPVPVDLYTIGIVLGAATGAILGAAPGPVLRAVRRVTVELKGGLFEWLSVRRFSRLREECEAELEFGKADGDACCRLATILWLLGQRSRSEQILQRALSAEDDHAVARHNYGVAQAAAGHYARALEEFARAKGKLDRSPTVSWNMGIARWTMGQLPDAVQAFRNAVELDETHLHARNALALALARQGEVEAGLSELEALPSRYREHPDVLCNLGVIHQSRGALDVAEGHFTRALRSDPSHEACRYNRGICAVLEGR
ncbi:MAG TPA: tetratricopeptide repeat protein, partial [Armatimonadota bacterium]|nr:tetratricopeptide repeat protein [Armatimonadota bacterium]